VIEPGPTDDEIVWWKEIVEQHHRSVDPYWREQVSRARVWLAHTLWKRGCLEEAAVAWDALSESDDDPEVVKWSLRGEGHALILLKRHRDAFDVYRRLAVAYVPDRGVVVQRMLAFALAAAVWIVVSLKLEGLILRLYARLTAKPDPSSSRG
jgi:hypothetical protein